MRIRVLIAVLLLAILVVGQPAAAQDKKPGCDPAALIATLAKLKSTGDQARDLQALLDVQSQIAAQNVVCNGYKWQGENIGVIGPFDLPEGYYKATLVTPGAFYSKFQAISGECKSTNLFFLWVLKGQADKGREEMIESQGCRAVIAIESSLGAWTLTIEPLK